MTTFTQPLDVLIVEDDPIVALAEVDMVESFGHKVVGVAAEAESTYRLASARVPSVALLDVNLADGRSGPAICARLIGQYGIPVVFVTANREQLPIDLAGALGCIEKPYSASTLGAALAFVRRYVADGSVEGVPYGLHMAPDRRLH
jgi:CheY-like chemotaxis protein